MKKLKKRIANLEKGALPRVTAGGELTGTYPDPQVGTVNGLTLARGNVPSQGIDFGGGWSLFRNAQNFLQLDNELVMTETPGGTNGLFLDG